MDMDDDKHKNLNDDDDDDGFQMNERTVVKNKTKNSATL